MFYLSWTFGDACLNLKDFLNVWFLKVTLNLVGFLYNPEIYFSHAINVLTSCIWHYRRVLQMTSTFIFTLTKNSAQEEKKRCVLVLY